MKTIWFVALSLITSTQAFAREQACKVNAKKTVAGILRIQENRSDIGIEALRFGSHTFDGERYEWYEVQGFNLKNGKMTSPISQTYSRVEFFVDNEKCILETYTLPLAN